MIAHNDHIIVIKIIHKKVLKLLLSYEISKFIFRSKIEILKSSGISINKLKPIFSSNQFK